METHDIDISGMSRMIDLRPAGPSNWKNQMPADGVRLGIARQKHVKAPVARIRLGANIVRHLRWQPGDKLNVLYDAAHVALVRSPTGSHTLSLEKHGKSPFTQFAVYDGPYAKQQERIRPASRNYVLLPDGIVIRWLP